LTCKNDGSAFTKVTEIVCKTGYGGIKTGGTNTGSTVTSADAVGCVSCSGAADVTGYTTCTSDANYKTDGSAGTMTAATCATGYALSGAAGTNC